MGSVALAEMAACGREPAAIQLPGLLVVLAGTPVFLLVRRSGRV